VTVGVAVVTEQLRGGQRERHVLGGGGAVVDRDRCLIDADGDGDHAVARGLAIGHRVLERRHAREADRRRERDLITGQHHATARGVGHRGQRERRALDVEVVGEQERGLERDRDVGVGRERVGDRERSIVDRGHHDRNRELDDVAVGRGEQRHGVVAVEVLRRRVHPLGPRAGELAVHRRRRDLNVDREVRLDLERRRRVLGRRHRHRRGRQLLQWIVAAGCERSYREHVVDVAHRSPRTWQCPAEAHPRTRGQRESGRSGLV
jgi:hypothetical protein